VTAKPRWRFWARGTLLTAICGHWIANVTLDGDQFRDAGLAYTWRASMPIVVQTVLILVVAVLLGSVGHTRGQSRRPRQLRQSHILALLTMCELVLFFILEVSERLVQREPFIEGVFGSGFGLELLLAIGAALFLVGLGSIAVRAIGSVRRAPTPARILDRTSPIPQLVPPAHSVVVVCDGRAPPLPA
jgi:hypothetical protein